MNPSLLEYFAVHEQLSDLDPIGSVNGSSLGESLAGPRPETDDYVKILEWDAKWRARLRFIRARAMVEEAERQQAVKPANPIHEMFYQAVEESGILKPKTTGLSFSEALVAMKAGKKVMRRQWDAGYYIKLDGDRFFDGLKEEYSFEAFEILAEDWEIVP